MLGENLGREPLRGRFGGDGLGAVLAELGRLSFAVGIGPGATRAVEPIFLIELEKRPYAAANAHLFHAEMGGFVDRAKTGRDLMPMGLVRAFFFERRLGAVDALGEMSSGIRGLLLPAWFGALFSS